MRHIILDTETTGLDPRNGDRLVEIGCVELINLFPTGQLFQVYLNPDRPVPQAAFDVHGLSDAFLADKPRFDDVADEFLAFLGEATLVIHNASFDMGFINSELKRSGRPLIGEERIIDTLQLARRKHPGAPVSLDALCDRYNIDRSKRVKHGALLDAELLAEIYIELSGGRQADLGLLGDDRRTLRAGQARKTRIRPVPLQIEPLPNEIAAHRALIASLGENALWRRYLLDSSSSAEPLKELIRSS